MAKKKIMDQRQLQAEEIREHRKQVQLAYRTQQEERAAMVKEVVVAQMAEKFAAAADSRRMLQHPHFQEVFFHRPNHVAQHISPWFTLPSSICASVCAGDGGGDGRDEPNLKGDRSEPATQASIGTQIGCDACAARTQCCNAQVALIGDQTLGSGGLATVPVSEENPARS